MKVLNQLDSLDNIKDGETRKLITKTTSSGNGNAVTSVSVSGDTITYTKGATYGTSNLALGETSSTAYRGDRGKTAYDHASDGNKLTTATDSGLYKIASTAEGHIKSLTAVQKSDITALGIPGSDNNTTYTLSADTTNNQIKLTPSTGSAQSITVPYATSAGAATNDGSGNAIANTYVKKAGDTMTGALTVPQINTGTDAANYFQSQKFRGEGNASTYYHAVDFGYSGHNQVDFYEYGGVYNFHKHTGSAIDSGDTLLGKITVNG